MSRQQQPQQQRDRFPDPEAMQSKSSPKLQNQGQMNQQNKNRLQQQQRQAAATAQMAQGDNAANNNQQSRFKFREFLSGVRFKPSSPDRGPSFKQQQQQPSTQRQQRIPQHPLRHRSSPKPLTPVSPDSRKESQPKPSIKQKQKPAEPAVFKQSNYGKSTEKLDESNVEPKGKEVKVVTNVAKLNKEREAEKMKLFVQTFMKIDEEELESQFDKLRSYIPRSFTRHFFDENADKCRFADIICMDQTRVTLEDCAEGGFVHANHVQFSSDNCSDRFIISQFPTANTTFDFWHMIWQEGITTVINIMTPEEWKECGEPIGLVPDSGKCRHIAEQYTVTFQKEVVGIKNEYKAIVYGIIHENECRQLLWINYLGWPEGRCPKDTEAILQVMSLTKIQRRPILVMSMAGAGRAGTYASIEYSHSLLHSLKPKKLSIIDCIHKIRDSRLHSIQTVHQFKFIYLVLIDHILAVKYLQNDLGPELIGRYEVAKQEILEKAWEEEKAVSNFIIGK